MKHEHMYHGEGQAVGGPSLAPPRSDTKRKGLCLRQSTIDRNRDTPALAAWREEVPRGQGAGELPRGS